MGRDSGSRKGRRRVERTAVTGSSNAGWRPRVAERGGGRASEQRALDAGNIGSRGLQTGIATLQVPHMRQRMQQQLLLQTEQQENQRKCCELANHRVLISGVAPLAAIEATRLV